MRLRAPLLLAVFAPLAAVCVTTLAALPAQASFIAIYSSSSPAGGGLTNHLYSLNFIASSSGDVLNPGDFLTFYDVGPVTALAPTGLTFSQALVGPTAGTPAGLTDASGILNATFTYNGPVLTTSTAFSVTLTSVLSGTANGFYTSRTTIPPTGSVTVFGATSLPAAATPGGAAPEPGSLALLLPVVGAVGMVIRKRKK